MSPLGGLGTNVGCMGSMKSGKGAAPWHPEARAPAAAQERSAHACIAARIVLTRTGPYQLNLRGDGLVPAQDRYPWPWGGL
jgi:hypothetical protein